MRFLSWLKRAKAQEPEPEDTPPPSPYETRKGNEIVIQKSSRWSSDDVGVYELRRHIAKSNEGYHAGLEVSRQGGEGPLTWSNARPTAQAAEQAAHRMQRRWFGEMSSELERLESLQQSYQQGVQPGAPSRTHSIFSDYPDRVLKTEQDVKKDDALLEMTLVVNEIANDPDTNWKRYKQDFGKAVAGMREAFEPNRVQRRHRAEQHGETIRRPPPSWER